MRDFSLSRFRVSLRSPAFARTILLAPLLVWTLSCGTPPAADTPEGEVWVEALVGGTFLANGSVLDLRAPESIGEGSTANGLDGRTVPLPSLAAVVDGWGGREPWGAWGVGEATRMRFHPTRPGAAELVIEAMAPEHPDGRDQAVTVLLDSVEVGHFEVGADWQTVRIVLPEPLAAGPVALELRYAWHLDGIPGRDDRPLALALERIALVEPGGSAALGPGGPGAQASPEQEALRLVSSGVYLVPLEIPTDAETLRFELDGPGDARVAISVLTLDGEIDGPYEGLADGVRELDLSALRGRLAVLLLDADLPAGRRVTLRRPRLVRGGVAEPSATAAGELTAEPLEGDEMPNIVVLVLDAARADHFSAYGYPRETTPQIDRLAAEGFVFDAATAECPYTMCSMPNLLSGLAFPQHGLVVRGLTLAEEVVTLAEVLQKLGYTTVGYTSNPNNSNATGTTQGFEELAEIWQTHPDAINSVLRERLAEGVEEPFFLLAHYVPPHEPYAPDPEHDLFGDPAYGGPVTSDREQTRAIYAGKMKLDAEDLAELVALYDGNLHMGDAALGEVFEMLREAGHWDDTVVVVTSDHGEAFLEHGRVGHNTTLYDDMLRVPLILRLPPRLRDRLQDEPDINRLAVLGDLVPTLLGVLGQAPPEAARGVDLLTAPVDPERVVSLRSSDPKTPVWGARTRRFKAMAQAHKEPGVSSEPVLAELYDLLADPGETHDLAAERPFLHAGLLLVLERYLAEPAPLGAAVQTHKLSERDTEMLKALGYL